VHISTADHVSCLFECFCSFKQINDDDDDDDKVSTFKRSLGLYIKYHLFQSACAVYSPGPGRQICFMMFVRMYVTYLINVGLQAISWHRISV